MEQVPTPSDQRPASGSEEPPAPTWRRIVLGVAQQTGPIPEGFPEHPPTMVLLRPPGPPPAPRRIDLFRDALLGKGSYSTMVFRGSFEGRAVAVKRALLDFVTLISRDVNTVRASGGHPNVMQYYHHETDDDFLYIAAELCPATLADVFDRPDEFRDVIDALEPKHAVRQITAGLHHLHTLNVIHREINPQNILVAPVDENGGLRWLISDFGLRKKFEYNRKVSVLGSFASCAVMSLHTLGWRAPEVIDGKMKYDDPDDEPQSLGGSVGMGNSSAGMPKGKLTKSVDIFALGCLYYYGSFGDLFERELNIMKNVPKLEGLEELGEEGEEGRALIKRMVSYEPYERPDTSACLMHPYFWDPEKRLTFLQDASDRFEIMCQDPMDADLLALEKGACEVVGGDWHSQLDKLFIENLGESRRYDGKSVRDLLRVLRDAKRDYQDLPDDVKRLLGTMPEGFLAYFTRRFPELFLHVHAVVSSSALRTESMFRSYYELKD